MIGVNIEGVLALSYMLLLLLFIFTCYFRLLAGLACTFTFMAIRLKPEWISKEIYFIVTGNEPPVRLILITILVKALLVEVHQTQKSWYNPFKDIPKNVRGMSSKVQIGIACATAVGGLAATYIASITLNELRKQTELQQKQYTSIRNNLPSLRR